MWFIFEEDSNLRPNSPNLIPVLPVSPLLKTEYRRTSQPTLERLESDSEYYCWLGSFVNLPDVLEVIAH